MTPHDVAADHSRLLRFQNEVAYIDRLPPSADEMRSDSELLGSKDGVLVIAWLWPNLTYDSDFDPFGTASRETPGSGVNVNGDLEPVSDEMALRTPSPVWNRRHQELPVSAARLMLMIESIAQAVGREVPDVMTHLRWSVPITQLELDRLLRGYEPISFPVVVALCGALQLEFADDWVLVDRERLARRIDQSVVASRVSDRLRSLALLDLESVEKRLPPASVGLEEAIYRAPRPRGRYWSLYEALAADERSNPVYTLAEIDHLLVAAGEQPLPPSATASDDRSWWAGTGTKTEGRPQVSAWWAAGYRIQNVVIDPSSNRVESIEFEALPGRDQWLASPERTARQEYRVPVPLENVKVALTELARATEALMSRVDLEGLIGALSPLANVLDAIRQENVPDDPDILRLTELLDTVGEADRSQIERHFSQPDVPVDAAWMTNLLTRARRQGWTVNKGTRRQPRWAGTRRRAMLIEGIADKCNLQVPVIDPADPVPAEFLRLVAAKIHVDSTGTSTSEIARDLVESRGGTWQPEFESADESLTSLGLEAIDEAIGTSWVWRPEWDQL